MKAIQFFAVGAVFLCGFLTIRFVVSDELHDDAEDDGLLGNGNFLFDFSPDFSEAVNCTDVRVPAILLKPKGNLNSSTIYCWNIYSNNTENGPTALLFEDVHLEQNDSLTISLMDENQTLLFGPYQGSPGPLVVIVKELKFIVTLSLSSAKSRRSFSVLYHDDCILPVPPSLKTLQAPIYHKGPNEVVNCIYTFNSDVPNSSAFVFKDFSLSPASELDVVPGNTYKMDQTPPDQFISAPNTEFKMTLNISGENNFTLMRRDIYSECSGYYTSAHATKFQSPDPLPLYNASTSFECRWLIKSDDPKKLGLTIENLQIKKNVLDMLIIKDGPSELSTPLIEATYINQNETKNKIVRTSGEYMWILFKSEAFVSNFKGNFIQYDQGGHFRGSGPISLQNGEDTEFLLEVAPDENVVFNFNQSEFTLPAYINVYDGFDLNSNLIAHLTGNVWYPIVSTTSKMRISTKQFKDGKFNATFRGMKPGCTRMSSSTNDAYVLSGNCNTSCAWIVPPRNVSDGVLLLGFELLSLGANDVIEVYRLNNSKASIAKITHGVNNFPQMTFDPSEGYYMKISRGDCAKLENEIIVVAHSTYLPACIQNIVLEPSKGLQILSPSFPNTYPLFASCQWNISVSGNTTQFLLSFDKFHLAPNHCIEIIGNKSSGNFSGSELPNDMLVEGNVNIKFNSLNCNGSTVPTSLASAEGFALNVNSSDCGGILTNTTGMFSTASPSYKGNSTCVWFIQVPQTEANGSVNSIKFSVIQKSDMDPKNYEFHVYDGPSVRDVEMNSSDNMWSHFSTVVFVYRRLNMSSSAPEISVKYNTINCNASMQCENHICLHPDWRCDGYNDCGDYTDEKNCGAVPVPDKVKESGISSVTFGLVTVLFFGLGIAAAVLVPKAIQRYRNSRYHNFQDYPGAE